MYAERAEQAKKEQRRGLLVFSLTNLACSKNVSKSDPPPPPMAVAPPGLPAVTRKVLG
jgi:hypothetical protein